MMVFQFDSAGESFIVVILEKGQLDRMEKADPLTLNPQWQGGLLAPIENPRSLHLLVAYEPDSAKLQEVLDNAPDREAQQKALFAFAMRGYRNITGVDGQEGIRKAMAEAEKRRKR